MCFAATLSKRSSFVFRGGGFGIGLYRHIDLGALFQAHLAATLRGEGVLDADLPVQIVGPFNVDLRFLGLIWLGGLDDFLYRSRQGDTWLFRHRLSFQDWRVRAMCFAESEEGIRQRTMEVCLPLQQVMGGFLQFSSKPSGNRQTLRGCAPCVPFPEAILPG